MTLRAKVVSRRAAGARMEVHDTGTVRCRGLRPGRPAASMDENAPFVFRNTAGDTLAQFDMTGLVLLAGQQRQTLIPQIEAVRPAQGAVAGGDTVTLAGNRFTAQTTVTIGGAAAAVTFVSSTELSVVTPAGAAGAAAVRVSHPGQAFHERADVFAYWAAPTVTGVAPNTGNPAGRDALVISGTGFQAVPPVVPTVTVGGTPATKVQWMNATTLRCVSPAGSVGAADVVVTNPDGQSGTLVAGFTFATGPAIAGSSPLAVHSEGGVQLTIVGTGFVAGATATVGGAACTSLVVVSAPLITCDAPALPEGLHDLVVANPTGPPARLPVAVEVFVRTIIVIQDGETHDYATADGWPGVHIDHKGHLHVADQVRFGL